MVSGRVGGILGGLAFGLYITCCLTQILITFHLLLVIKEYLKGTLGVPSTDNKVAADRRLNCIDAIALPAFVLIGLPLMLTSIIGIPVID
jgi:hypothetical protein